MPKTLATVMDAQAVHRALVRIAHEILERNGGASGLAIIGIKRRGDILGARLKRYIADIEKADIPFGAMDITLYRDDLQSVAQQPIVHTTEIHNFAQRRPNCATGIKHVVH